MKTPSAAIVAVLLLAGCSGQPASNAPEATATPETSASSPPEGSSAPSTGPMAYEDIEHGTDLEPGTYVLHYSSIGGMADFPTLAMTFTVPDGWSRVLIDGAVWGDGIRVVFAVVDNLYIDPCDPILGLRDPPVGGSVDDLATTLGSVPGWEITEADHDLYFGYPAVRIVLSGPADVGSCPQEVARLVHTLGFPGFLEAASGGERQELWILEVGGTRLVINAVSAPDASPDDRAELQAVLDSIQIQP